ncbi:hypothetical protein, partial [Streptomyces ardesiacus]
QGEPPDAVFCYNDLLAIGAMHTLARAGRAVTEASTTPAPARLLRSDAPFIFGIRRKSDMKNRPQ